MRSNNIAYARHCIKLSIAAKQQLLGDKYLRKIDKMACRIVSALRAGGKVIAFGNGGSAADAQHLVAELVGRFKKERKALPAISLTTNTSILTALSNDYSYDIIFERQIEALAGKNDIVIAISTSGKARNVNWAVKYAKKMKLPTIALTGRDGGELARIADDAIIIPSEDTPAIQECHILVIHILCGLIEEQF